MARALVFAAACLLALPATAATTKEDALWTALRGGGHFAMVRHATAPGTGDPAGFSLRDCSTQRNLSEAGRDQARGIGARMRANGMASARIYASQWCRCLETARLLGLGTVRELPILNSFFQRDERGGPQTAALRKWLAAQDLSEPVVLVTHQVNITALTGVYPASGEVIVVRRGANGELAVTGTVRTD